jgi:hypothetical protein
MLVIIKIFFIGFCLIAVFEIIKNLDIKSMKVNDKKSMKVNDKKENNKLLDQVFLHKSKIYDNSNNSFNVGELNKFKLFNLLNSIKNLLLILVIYSTLGFLYWIFIILTF